MTRDPRKFVAVCLVSLLICTAPAAWAQKRPITEKDLLKFQWVADPQIWPDGAQAAYVLVTANEKEDRYDTSAWIVGTTGSDSPRRLTAGPSDAGPQWSPDNRTLAFNRSRPGEPAQIHLLPVRAGGEARRLTDLPKGAGAASWSPDGKSIAFNSTTTADDLEWKKKGTPPPKKSDVRVITRAVYRADGAGWLDPTSIAHIWTVPVNPASAEPAEAKQITFGKYSEDGVDALRRENQHADYVCGWRRRYAHAARAGRRTDVPRAESAEENHRDGALPGRDARPLAHRQAFAPRRAAPAHRQLVRQIPAGRGHQAVRPAAAAGGLTV